MDVLSHLPFQPVDARADEQFEIRLTYRRNESVLLSIHAETPAANGPVVEDITSLMRVNEFASLSDALDFIYDAVRGNRVRQEADLLRELRVDEN